MIALPNWGGFFYAVFKLPAHLDIKAVNMNSMKKYLRNAAATVLIAGLSLSAHAQFVIRVRPAAPVVRVRPIAPSPAHVWVSGDWVWRGGRYVWTDGYWAAPPRRGHYWRDGHWKNTRRGWVWVPGRWRN
jgi:WXXGXW repeat (2 copies)